MRLTFAFSLSFFLAILSDRQSPRLLAQSPQNPSPMVEHVREHPRLEKKKVPGQRFKLQLGELFMPEKWDSGSAKPDSNRNENNPNAIRTTKLVLAFHCGNWIPEIAVSQLKTPLPCISFQLGSGSAKYAQPFQDDPKLLKKLLTQAEEKLSVRVDELILVGWSAGYGAVGELLKSDFSAPLCSSVLLIDGLHGSYVDGKPGPQESKLVTDSLQPFLKFASKASKSEKRMIVLHSEIFPGTFASTTETADWLINQLELKRTPVLKWGPMRTQQLGETQQGKLQIRAFAGNSAPDHVDLLHGMPEFLAELVEQ